VLRVILYFISIKEDALAKLTNAHTENTQHLEKSTSFAYMKNQYTSKEEEKKTVGLRIEDVYI
jgi:hypothetical protein